MNSSNYATQLYLFLGVGIVFSIPFPLLPSCVFNVCGFIFIVNHTLIGFLEYLLGLVLPDRSFGPILSKIWRAARFLVVGRLAYQVLLEFLVLQVYLLFHHVNSGRVQILCHHAEK